jgi:integrase
MGRISDAKITTPTARAKLKWRSKPYYRAIGERLQIGYRRGVNGGSWVARIYDGSGVYRIETIGMADSPTGEVMTYHAGVAKAQTIFAKDGGAQQDGGPYTVAECLEEYLAWMEHARKSAKDTRYRVDRILVPELGAIECGRLTKADIEKWLHAEAKAPARLRSKADSKQNFKPISDDPEAQRKRRATANRVLAILKGALNRAWREGKIHSDAAWRRVEPFEGADAARVRYLTIAEAQRLINASAPDFRLLVRAALATGCRYGELAALRVADFNPDAGTIHIRTSKSGKGRHIVLADEGIALFAALAAGRPAEALLLTRANGGQWRKSDQSRPMRDASKAGRIEPEANFHCLRHTYASHAVMNGAPLLVVAKNLGHADTRMVEKHYGHLAPSYIAEAIRAAAPRFGTEPTNVVGL